MKSICQDGYDIIITSYLEEVTTKGDQQVGAMRVKANAKPAKEDIAPKIAPISGDGTIYGCPVPPCPDQ